MDLRSFRELLSVGQLAPEAYGCGPPECASPCQCVASNSSVACACLHLFSCAISCTARSPSCTVFPIFLMIPTWQSRRGGGFARNCLSPCRRHLAGWPSVQHTAHRRETPSATRT